MKARLATEIGRRLTVTLKNEVKLKINKVFPVGTDFDTLPKEFTEEYFEEEYNLNIQSRGLHPVYNTLSGKLEPGCLYWDNQEKAHLMAVLPNGDIWDIDSRASNCTMKEDRNHRCWCRHGEVPNITVDKVGVTCSAGGGSIQSGDYHGFLINGEFRP